MREDTRRPEHAKDQRYESLVARVNEELRAIPVDRSERPRRPVLFIVGQPRSGSTLCYQVLAASGAFGYPTNLIARFFERPAHGARLQALAAAWLGPPTVSFSSRGGRTESWADPHEFGYFWERRFPFTDHHQPDDAALGTVDVNELRAQIAELERELDRPVAFKNLLLDFCLPFVAKALPTSVFLNIRRPLADVADSLLRIRLSYYGDDRSWFSVRPGDADTVADQTGAVQVAHQIAAIEGAVGAAREAIDDDRWLEVEYLDVCDDPRGVAARVAAACGTRPSNPESIPHRFERSNAPARNDRDRGAVYDALRERGLEP